MGESQSDNESLYARIRQLEQERDELQKDIEQLYMEQAGPVATQMHFRRIAGLELEIENLKKKLVACTKEKSILEEELAEAKRIKTHLDQLLKEEVQKNTEVVKQLEYLRGVIANAFADRDHAIMEAERAKENEDMVSQKLNDVERRLQELTAGSYEMQDQLTNMQIKLEKQEKEMEIYRIIVDKFYKIRQHACGVNDESSEDYQSKDLCWEDKCACLNNDPSNMWSFNVNDEASSTYHIAALKKELETVKADFQYETKMAWEIQKHMQKENKDLQRKIEALEKKMIRSNRHIFDGISLLRQHVAEQKIHIMNLFDEEKSHVESIVTSILEEVEKSKDISSAVSAEDINTSVLNTAPTIDSDALTRALQEKVSALLLLSQEEERHLWEENVHSAVQETMDELQKTLKQVTEEKVRALVELALLKQEYHLLLEKTTEERNQGNILSNAGERGVVIPGRDGKLKNLLKKTSMKFWLGNVPHSHLNHDESLANRRANRSREDARLQIENATLKESMHSLERLTSNIHKLRISLLQVIEAAASEGTSRVIDEILSEAELVKTALGSALPLSWSGEEEIPFAADADENQDSNAVKVDSVTAAGLEMVELLTLAAQVMRQKVTHKVVTK